MENTLPAELERLSSRKLVLNLSVDPQRRVTIRSCEIVGKDFRNRTSFGDSPETAQVLAEPIVQAVDHCIRRVKDEDSVISLPDFLVQLPGLLLRGAHLLVRRVNAGDLAVILRFQQFLGNLGALFHKKIAFDEGLSDQTDQLAALAFSDIALPVLNVIEAIRLGQDSRQALKALSSLDFDTLSREIEFNAELLKRFIHQSQLRRNPPTPPPNLPGIDPSGPALMGT